MSSHTKGPWSYDRGIVPPDGPGHYSTISAGDVVIAEVNDLIPEGLDNARLIEAAPDLLAELTKAADQLQGWVNWKCPTKHVPEHEAYIATIRALIAKVTS